MFGALKAALSPKERLKRVLGDFELPVFPTSISSALADLSSNNFDLGKIGDSLACDPGVSAELLRLVNSAAFGLRRPAEATRHAASLLGRNRLEAALIALGAKTSLPKDAAPGYDPRDFWRAARARAQVAGDVAEALHPAQRAESVTAALLLDMAIPALAHARPESYGAVFEQHNLGGGALPSLEEEAGLVGHDAVGGWLSEAWAFPPSLRELVSDHHVSPSRLPAVALVTEPSPRFDEDDRARFVANAKGTFNVDEDRAAEIFTSAL